MSREKVLEAAGVRAIFSPQGDRFVGRIELLPSDAFLIAVDEPAIFEKTSDVWPPSPPLQDVHLEDRPDGLRLALMVGRAGVSHWSISCELNPPSGELAFDVACRIKETALWLGSTYQLSPGLEYQGDSSSGEIRHQGTRLAQLSAESPARICWDPELRVLQIRPAGDAAEASSAGEENFPQTIRWRYSVRVRGAAKTGGN